ncbi:hypothetical protein M422DRAFT_261637 [Sphaerobolus stellatus SS14]|uniref:Uncharacterized protein n=1 Tax=Sphaerobolus stellatus (strain SS14) TaxID=990650 RepID=A0A0C9VEP0_SPHS4|nr:hypothetical protein M422DRAFT_261637 [Sphaerobolus stellatus SS14]
MDPRRSNGLLKKVFSVKGEDSRQLVRPEKRNSFFALMIGIDDHALAVAHFIKGAVADTEAFRDYLVKRLHVAQHQ